MKKNILSVLAPFFACFLSANAICSSINDPERIVLEYAIAYQNQKWSEAATYLHPKLLKDMQNKIVDILKRVEESGRDELLSEFGVATIKDLEILSPEQFYVVNQNRRYKGATTETKLMKQTKFQVESIKLKSNDEYIIELRSTVAFNSTQKEKSMTCNVIKFENNWKIIKTADNK
jgi:hypothetical protein